LALGVLIGVLPLIPPEHVHESDINGQHEALIHRHGGSPLAEHSAPHAHADDPAFDHADGSTVLLDAFFTVPGSYVAVGPTPALVALLILPPVTVAHGPTSDVERLIHGPPRAPTGLRAPPSSARL
jgi:hypothetical protein